MLLDCPECGHNVSNKAVSCPNCGYPITSPKLSQKSVKSRITKRQRLPNGFGRITEIKNRNLRKPFRVMISDGTDSNGKPIGKLLKPTAYFETYNEAYTALIKYHENPYTISTYVTMEELYDRWSEEISKKVSASRMKQIKSAWKYCDLIKTIPVREIRIRDVKNLLDNGYRVDKKGNIIKPSENFKSYITMTISQMLDYAVEYELINHNFMKDVHLASEVKAKNAHSSFTEEEMNIIKENAPSDPVLMMMLINCYMGWRPSELCNLEVSHVNLNNKYIIGGSKTENGIDRKVPIHSYIHKYIANLYNDALFNGRTYLFDVGELLAPYNSYSTKFKDALTKYNLDQGHRPHDCRKHFVTMAKKSGVDEYAIKRIIGHSISDITENIYTDRDIDWLKKEVEKIH